ncbi:bifunctional 5,10-methylenetetrahydrofolate dehydrogenase/5,10-methenyltetrahydrofolate cyclohydrolase [Olsenella sp. HMSC062G07]|uniref:bifunctional 5,10-methylenetetrahydrofolate dehydrogenase/5,10-methenyltetrahydrofolate cyclohydrolase n=1 Tax=Olsenella sp. HMSC062G07 TaxID=1739330 RepID=UPI0008A5720E|nr:bifunctional 5,10-methylenetetrahydrofolate dehydrogenase/5,10-methenyltetrahydrofolate cyclohydrolase [Olsenella sp. HMSC062G07]OFK24356.1 bifunctional 5,10-methylene-tetrahydrofolate dehydrogenase/5,10-methylene-tetrahydrofolate cyclohydrolase [Olsenella sp. HMSC062G07]
MAELLRGAPAASALCERLSGRVLALKEAGVTPRLAIVRVGERADDLAYERGALKRCGALGIAVERVGLSADCSQKDLLEAIDGVNADASVHGCLLFRPLPAQLDEEEACERLAPEKDVDGITSASLYGVFSHRRVGFAPCTAEAVLALLEHHGVELSGACVTVIGRSLVIGRPVSLLLQAADATVTMCHTRTRDLAASCAGADVVVVAAGHPGTFGASCAKKTQVVVDVGINWDVERGRLVGDVNAEAVAPLVRALTPVPGGVGSLTTAMLAKHVVEAAERTVV